MDAKTTQFVRSSWRRIESDALDPVLLLHTVPLPLRQQSIAAGSTLEKPMKPKSSVEHVCLVLLLLAAAAPAAAQQPTLTSRLSSVVGSFIVGYSTLSDRGSFSETLNTLDAAFSRDEADAGSVNGVLGTTPVQGSASFAVTQDYAITPLLISAMGSGASSADTPFSYVSVGAQTASQVRLRFSVLVPTPYVLTGEVLHSIGDPVQGVTPTASALARLAGSPGGGGAWLSTSTPGSFAASGTFMPGFTYELEGRAKSNLNASSSFVMNLVLSPVPEPHTALLMALGVVGLWGWRRRASRETSS